MSVLGSLIQSNPNNYFFALEGASPPSPGPVSLTSPVVVIPDVSGNTTLALNAGSSGASALSVVGSSGAGIGDSGGTGTITVGGFGAVYRATVQDSSGVLQIGLNSGSVPPVIQYDALITHQLLLGDKDPSATASVQTNVPFIVRDYTTDPGVLNGIAMNVASPTATSIVNAVATAGSMTVGPSQACPAVLTMSGSAGTGNLIVGGNGGAGLQLIGGSTDVLNAIRPAVATAGALSIGASQDTSGLLVLSGSAGSGNIIVGGNGGGGLQLVGGTTNALNVIRPAVASAGTLSIGSSFTTSPNQIVIQDTSLQLGKDVTVAPNYPCMTTRLAVTTPIGGGLTTISMGGLPDGYYLGLLQPKGSGTTDVPTLTACLTFNFYVRSNLIVSGGVAQNTAGNVFTQPQSGQGAISFQNNSGNNILADIVLSQMCGPVVGY